ncbi:MAG: cell division protein FtsQ [Boseongicola sp. SB0662_bin_57]|nr:cell division protein FtsQ [Boseongicola sp. SB0662_bin_57]
MRTMKDPAPSRLEYRMKRLMLRPSMRPFRRYGMPVIALATLAGLWALDEGRRESALAFVAELRNEIGERPEFIVRMMIVEGASPELAASIRESLSIEFPVSPFSLRLDELREKVEALDAVARASLQVRSRGVLIVAVDERVPVAVWRSDGGLQLLDKTGYRVATVPSRVSRRDLPLVAGLGADAAIPEALLLYDVARPVRDRLRGFIRVGERRWDVVLDRGQTIRLPETQAVTAFKRVIELDVAQDLLERDISVVDFRNSQRPVLRLGQTAIGTLNDG